MSKEEEKGELKTEAKHPLIEPHEKAEEELAAEAPKLANVTTDPNRMTIYVPSEHSMFSMGTASAQWIPDPGITAKTDHHMHFFVVGAGAEVESTVVSLGTGSVAANIDGYDPAVGHTVNGYVMLTNGLAWHESEQQHVIVSREGLVAIRAKDGDIGIQSDEKRVYSFGDKGNVVASKDRVLIASQPGHEAQELTHEHGWEPAWFESAAAKLGTTLIEAVELFTAAKAIKKGVSTWPKEKTDAEGHSTWKTKAKHGAKIAADILATANTIARVAAEIVAHESPGTVGIVADKDVGISGGASTTIYGGRAAALVSLCHAELLAGSTAIVHGNLGAELLGGLEVSIESKKVEIEGEEEVEINSHEDVFIGAHRNAIVSGGEHAMVCAVEGHGAVLGHKTATLGAGPAGKAGAGVFATEKDVTMGLLTDVNGSAPARNQKKQFNVTEKLVEAQNGESYVMLKEEEITISAKTVKLMTDSGATIECHRDTVCVN